MRIGVLTGGGDCPGLNAAIRAIVRRAYADEVEVLGIRNGWLGLVENDVVWTGRRSPAYCPAAARFSARRDTIRSRTRNALNVSKKIGSRTGWQA